MRLIVKYPQLVYLILRAAKFQVVAILCFVVFSGCDHTKVVSQSLTINVSDRNHGRISCKEIAVREHVQKTGVDIEREKFNPGRFSNLYPWSESASIGVTGQAVIVVNNAILVDPKWKSPPIDMHPFTGKTILVKILGCSENIPIFQLRAVPGESYSRGSLEVKVVSVSEAEFQ